MAMSIDEHEWREACHTAAKDLIASVSDTMSHISDRDWASPVGSAADIAATTRAIDLLVRWESCDYKGIMAVIGDCRRLKCPVAADDLAASLSHAALAQAHIEHEIVEKYRDEAERTPIVIGIDMVESLWGVFGSDDVEADEDVFRGIAVCAADNLATSRTLSEVVEDQVIAEIKCVCEHCESMDAEDCDWD